VQDLLLRTSLLDQVNSELAGLLTHIRNIYAKLQAQDRSSAVRRARKMRLLSAGLNGLA
jgi:LuxR family maltose regulon positive regulatory protein